MVNCGIAIRLPSYKNRCEFFWNEPFYTQGALAYRHLMKQFDDGSIGSFQKVLSMSVHFLDSSLELHNSQGILDWAS